MYYIALLWNDSDEVVREVAASLLSGFLARARGWRAVLDRDGIAVACCGDRGPAWRIYPLSEGQGVVIGRLFEKAYADRSDTEQTPPREVAFDRRRTDAVVTSAGRELIASYWGQYVAFVHDRESGMRWVLRDPTGAVPCQRTSILGVDVYFVRLEDCQRLGPLDVSINDHFVLGYLMYAMRCVRETALTGIETVLPGECIAHAREVRTQSFYWNPLEIARRDPIEDFGEAARMTRRTVSACVHAWASCCDHVLLSLSGGLDSSIVLSCLARAPTSLKILCRNHFAVGANTDERVYARRAAERAGVELIEDEVRSDFNVGAMSSIQKSLFPVPWPVDVERIRSDDLLLRSLGVAAVFNGNGGDELFFRGGTFPGSVDYAWQYGLRPAILPIALDDAVLAHASVWRVLRFAYLYGMRRRPWHMRLSISRDYLPLMTSRLKAAARRDLGHWHPLYRDVRDVPPGKMEQAYLLTYGALRTHMPGRSDDAPTDISPLRSQPLMELCLRTPLYVLSAGGRDRAVARRAFAEDVPWEIIARRSKVCGDAVSEAVMSRNIRLVRDLLLDGYLVRKGFLDLIRLQQVLTGEVSRLPFQITELCTYLSVELWARNWRDGAQSGSQCMVGEPVGTSPTG